MINLSNTDLFDLRRGCVDFALRSMRGGEPVTAAEIVKCAKIIEDYITGSKDAAIIAAAKELARVISGERDIYAYTATGQPLSA